MQINKLAPLSLLSILALAACGGGGGGGGGYSVADYEALASNPNLASLTPDATVNSKTGSASYSGIANIVIGGDVEKGYLGNLNTTVNFNTDTVTGSANNFSMFFSAIADPKNGQSVSGSLSLNGVLTGNNIASNGSGIAGTAVGSIDGTALNMDMDGNITGLNGEGMMLWLDDDVAEAIGGGLLLQ